MTQITHREIVDRLEALNKEHDDAYRLEVARTEKERASLRELCGGLGHFFKTAPYSSLLVCAFCEQVNAPPGAPAEPTRSPPSSKPDALRL